jgi:hypothetical protein
MKPGVIENTGLASPAEMEERKPHASQEKRIFREESRLE